MEGIPVVFATPRSLRALNVVAVAASLAACTSAVFMRLDPPSWAWVVVAGVPTFVVGGAWAALLRWQKATRSGLRYGWLLSVPLAMLNAALAGGLYCMTVPLFRAEDDNTGSFFTGALLGATFGVMFWLPSLLAVLTAFGLPIARAQRLAQKGLAGEERGELLVGGVSIVLSTVALILSRLQHLARTHDYELAGWSHFAPAGVPLFYAFFATAIACGSASIAIATMRERRRRRFVERVERSEEPGYRVEPTTLGKVLVRVAPVTSYRVADRAEELFELDDEGRATHRLAMDPPR
jgi:hypothetical protein